MRHLSFSHFRLPPPLAARGASLGGGPGQGAGLVPRRLHAGVNSEAGGGAQQSGSANLPASAAGCLRGRGSHTGRVKRRCVHTLRLRAARYQELALAAGTVCHEFVLFSCQRGAAAAGGPTSTEATLPCACRCLAALLVFSSRFRRRCARACRPRCLRSGLPRRRQLTTSRRLARRARRRSATARRGAPRGARPRARTVRNRRPGQGCRPNAAPRRRDGAADARLARRGRSVAQPRGRERRCARPRRLHCAAAAVRPGTG